MRHDFDSQWNALVTGESELARLRLDIYQSEARTETLRVALMGSPADTSTALTFLQNFPDDVPQLLSVLVNRALTMGWAPMVWPVLMAARPRSLDTRLAQIVSGILPTADEHDFLRLGELLACSQCWSILAQVVSVARSSEDQGIRDIGEYYYREYRSVLAPLREGSWSENG
ncbi:hypothetical protein D5S17_28650 [Pseudonocardiaceae bacterium YIM PH 21723]|nr:hypothetical protein D5S17_28650 [Pseudonocardiaceae bacterium YIM PH 21723]